MSVDRYEPPCVTCRTPVLKGLTICPICRTPVEGTESTPAKPTVKLTGKAPKADEPDADDEWMHLPPATTTTPVRPAKSPTKPPPPAKKKGASAAAAAAAAAAGQ